MRRKLRTEVGPPRWYRSGKREVRGIEEEEDEEGEVRTAERGKRKPDRPERDTDCAHIGASG